MEDDSLNRPSWCHGGRCALFEAISTDDSDLLGALLRGCGERLDVNLRNGQGLTPLHFAVRQRNAPMVKLLLGHPGCDPDIKDNLLAQVPLHEMVGSLHRPPRPGDQPHVSLVKPFSLVVRKDPGPPRAVDCGDGFESAGDDDADDADDDGGNASNVPYLELFSSLAERCDFNIPCRANKVGRLVSDPEVSVGGDFLSIDAAHRDCKPVRLSCLFPPVRNPSCTGWPPRTAPPASPCCAGS